MQLPSCSKITRVPCTFTGETQIHCNYATLLQMLFILLHLLEHFVKAIRKKH